MRDAMQFYEKNQYLPLSQIKNLVETGWKTDDLTVSEEIFMLKCCDNVGLYENEEERRNLSKAVWEFIIIYPTVSHYNALIENAIENNSNLDVEKVLGEAEQGQAKLNKSTVIKLLEYYCKIGNMDKANEILKEHNDIGQETLNCLLLGNARVGNSKACDDILKIMKEHKIDGDAKQANHLLKVFSELNSIESVENILENFPEKDIEPGTLIYAYVAFCKHKNHKGKHTVYERIPWNIPACYFLHPFKQLLGNNLHESAVYLLRKCTTNVENTKIFIKILAKNVTTKKAVDIILNSKGCNLLSYDFLLFYYAGHTTIADCLEAILIPGLNIKNLLLRIYRPERDYIRRPFFHLEIDDFIDCYVKYLREYDNVDENYRREKILYFIKAVQKEIGGMTEMTKRFLHILRPLPDEAEEILSKLPPPRNFWEHRRPPDMMMIQLEQYIKYMERGMVPQNNYGTWLHNIIRILCITKCGQFVRSKNGKNDSSEDFIKLWLMIPKDVLYVSFKELFHLIKTDVDYSEMCNNALKAGIIDLLEALKYHQVLKEHIVNVEFCLEEFNYCLHIRRPYTSFNQKQGKQWHK